MCRERLLYYLPAAAAAGDQSKFILVTLQDSLTQRMQLYNNNTHTQAPASLSLCGLRAVICCAIVFYYSPQTPASRNPSIIQ